MLAPDRGDLKEWAYVAASRARNETRIYLAESSLDHEHEPPAAPAPHGDALERLAAAAARPANERLATDPPRETLAKLLERRDALRATSHGAAGRHATSSESSIVSGRSAAAPVARSSLSHSRRAASHVSR